MDIVSLIQHPERLDRDTLYELRSMLALYPYFQTARLLMLQNLYLLHDPSFDEELRRAAIYISDRRVLFKMIEAAHYKLDRHRDSTARDTARADGGSRTMSLIENFLQTLPKDDDNTAGDNSGKRKPTPADATVDYVAYLLEAESEAGDDEADTPQMKGQNLIDNFIENDKGKIVLNATPALHPDIADTPEGEQQDEGFFTETLARIYIKQGRYLKALEIIQRLSLQHPKKNAYFADQIRFLEKLIINNRKK